MSRILGAVVLAVVSVAVGAVVAVVVVGGTVVAVVGAPIRTDETVTVPTFSVYTFSMLARLTLDVFESRRYPQLPSLNGKIVALSYISVPASYPMMRSPVESVDL
ncbi:MAG TPA: hypothetical protein VHN82_01280, partial [Methanoregula sp.]|nr:hypothetical protein [Methanoregula sp.]